MAPTAHNSTARAILYAFLANFGIAIAKTWAAMYTGSGSMLAEAIHSYADTGNQVLLYLGLTQSKKPPDKEHPWATANSATSGVSLLRFCYSALGGCSRYTKDCTNCSTRKSCQTSGSQLQSWCSPSFWKAVHYSAPCAR